MFRVCLNTVVVDLYNVLRLTVSENHFRHLSEVLTPRLEPQVLAALFLKNVYQEMYDFVLETIHIRDFAPLDKKNVS